VQLKSFQDFLQLDTPPEKRKKEGLYKVFAENFPIADTRNNFVLEFLDYYIDPPRYTIDECIARGLTYSVPLKAKLKLYCTDPDHEDFDTVIQDVYLGPIPYMTERGTFVINGAERVVVSQLHRSPGVFFGQSTHANGTKLYSARIIPFKGSWIEFATDINNVMYAYIDRKKKLPSRSMITSLRSIETTSPVSSSTKSSTQVFKTRAAEFATDINNVMYAYIDRKKKLPVTTLLRAIGFESDKDILEIFNLAEEVKVSKANLKKLIGRKLAARVLKTWVEDFVDEDTGELFLLNVMTLSSTVSRFSIATILRLFWNLARKTFYYIVRTRIFQIMLSSIIRFRKTLVTLKRKLSCIFIVSCEMQNLQMKQVPVKLFRTCSSLKSVMI